MSENPKVISSKGDVPFSWEQKPGISKATPQFNFHHHPKLPPPPCGAAPPATCGRSSFSYHRDLQVPLPPCTFQAAAGLRNSSQKGAARKQDDPFLIAYKECTKTVRSPRFSWFSKDNDEDKVNNNNNNNTKKKKKKKSSNNNKLLFSCKNSCGVMEDNIVRVSQLPRSRSLGEEKWTP